MAADAVVALAWHDVTCPEGEDCRDRPLHAASSPVAHGGILSAFLTRIEVLSAATERCARCGHSPEAHDWGSLCEVCLRCPGFVRAPSSETPAPDPTPTEALRGRLAEALLIAILGTDDRDLVAGCDLPADEIARLIVEHRPDAVLAVLAPAPDSGGEAAMAGFRANGHRWPCTRFYSLSSGGDRCTCRAAVNGDPS